MPLTRYYTTDNAQSTLKVGVSGSTTTLILQDGEGTRFPPSFPFWVEIAKWDGVNVLKRELATISNRVGDVLTVTRGAGACLPSSTSNTRGTTQYSFDVGDSITHILTPQQIEGISASVQDLETSKLNASGGTRTGLTANGVIITDENGDESFLTGSNTEYIGFLGGVPTLKVPSGSITGEIRMWSTDSPPTGWLICDGSAKSRTTYAALFGVLATTYGAGDGSTTFHIPDLRGRVPIGREAAVSKGTVTITIATPGVVTLSSHGLANGNKVYLTTTGALPTGISASTRYYVVNATVNTFQLSATLGGSAINTTGTQSGTHTLFSANFDTLGSSGGEVNHTLSVNEMPSHSHTYTATSSAGAPTNAAQIGTTSTIQTNSVDPAGGSLSHNNLPPYITLHYIIAY